MFGLRFSVYGLRKIPLTVNREPLTNTDDPYCPTISLLFFRTQISSIYILRRERRHDEGRHEEYLIEMINEERLRYAGSIVRGLNEALVELTGVLTGFTLAL